MPVTIALTPGDFNSIGPEVLLKSVATLQADDVRFLLISPASWIREYARITGLPNLFESGSNSSSPYTCWWPERQPVPETAIELGALSAKTGALSMQAVGLAAEACLNSMADAMVTAPISKEAIATGGYTFPGHTEFLAEKTGCANYTMMLVSQSLRVGLATTHIPVGQIASTLTTSLILEKLEVMNRSLRRDFHIEAPKIAVLGLNPHAGDGGILGSEETTIIQPAIDLANLSGLSCFGPFPADGWFGSSQRTQYDGVLAMYHDQGLAPFKALSFGGGVNFTAGLPIIRTSPDHGTGFSLAGKNSADHRSMKEAIELAISMAINSKR